MGGEPEGVDIPPDRPRPVFDPSQHPFRSALPPLSHAAARFSMKSLQRPAERCPDQVRRRHRWDPNVDDGEAVIIGTVRAIRRLSDASWPSRRKSPTVHIQGAMEPAEAGHAAADQVHVARDVTTSPADFTVGLQPCPPAALPQALGRFLQEASLPPRPRPSHLALSFRRRAFLGREILRRPSASCWPSDHIAV
jgi:hypothetical protein